MKTSKTSGFTLIELLVAIAVFGILVGLAVPQLHNFTRDNRMTAQFNNFVTALQLARSEAVRRNAHVILCASTNQTTCNTSNWESGWIIFVDASNDYFTNSSGRPSGSDSVLKVGAALGGNDTLRSNDFAVASAVGYLPSGATDSTNPSGTFTLCDPGDPSDANNTIDRQKRALAVNISPTGFISQATDTNSPSDGIVNDDNSTDTNNVTCP